MKVLGIIPARGGSKGIPKKNLYPVAGKPLIAHSILSAKESKHLSRLIVSTDCEEIAKVATEYGADVPFIRPKELAQDLSLSVDVVKHALEALQKNSGEVYDAVVLLQPTTPLRRSVDIDRAVEKLFETSCDSVVSFASVGANHPARMYFIDGEVIKGVIDEEVKMRPRQELPDVFIRSGDIYATTLESLKKTNSLIGKDTRPYFIHPKRAVNIDTQVDLIVAEALLKLEHEGRLT